MLEAQGSVLTNKYAEGYPGKRYYGGCEYVDIAEDIAIDRAKKLFGAPWANVQAHSGSQANAAVYLALLNPGDTILGMSLAHGGHLTHGAKVNFSGKLYNFCQYGVREDTGRIDYDELAAVAQREPSPYLAQAYRFGLLEDFDHLYRYAALLDRLEGPVVLDADGLWHLGDAPERGHGRRGLQDAGFRPEIFPLVQRRCALDAGERRRHRAG